MLGCSQLRLRLSVGKGGKAIAAEPVRKNLRLLKKERNFP